MKKILVANRGEIACRIIRSCRRLGLGSVAVYSEADAGALHVQMADESHPVGPAQPVKSYLVIDNILEAARRSGADAVHPGYGFLAENAAFARAVEDSGMTWIGPRPGSIEAMGVKDQARDIAAEVGVPVVPGSEPFEPGELFGLEDAAAAVGYPLLVKATGGGGGIGMQVVHGAQDSKAAVERTQTMAANMFANGAVYLERYIPHGRHVEIQVFGDGMGAAAHLFERDCSLQRRYQKIIEEAPAPAIRAEVRSRMAEAAVELCRRTRYRGAGTIEYLYEPQSESFYFLEMNTRIQVEHPATEMITGTDLIAMQIDLARGAAPALDPPSVRARGHAIECRLYAERPEKNFMPSPGTLTRFVLPESSDRLRIDTGYRAGDKVTVYYDPLVAKLVSHGDTRDEAITVMCNALERTDVEGIGTNRDFLLTCLRHPEFVAARVFTQFVAAHRADLLG